MFNGPENLGKFHQRKCDKSYSKDPFFLCCQTLHNRIELHQDQYLFMHRLLNLSPSGNLSHCVFFSVDLFFRRKPMNITSAVAGNPGFHHKKNCIVLNCF